MRFRSFEFLVAAWFFMFGASIGSFLNVVIYRSPQGLSLLGSSRCPFCRSKIRSYHNIPVFAWIALRGRCRDCRLPISSRYPVIEFATGLIFVVLAIFELFLAGENLPADYGDLRLNITWLMGRVPLDLVAVFLYHATLLSILLSWAMIKFDGHVLPRFYMFLALAVGLAVPAVNGSVQPVSWVSTVPAWIAEYGWMVRLDTSVVGLAVGLVTGLAFSSIRVVNKPSPTQRPGYVRDAMAMFGIVGLYLGWQAVLSVVGIVACARLLSALGTAGKPETGRFGAKPPFGGDSKSAIPSSIVFIYLLLAAAAQILLWDQLAQATWWPGPNCSALAVAVVAAMAALLTLAADGIERLSLPSGDIPE
ncbi:MAG: prepilin peptidase [Planctomycetes bacterium]|nr:prepilin peptidase [Planctomycetota bacterium]MBL7044242.1 prepilin peptidase [Pirellulaceae bacterium]